MEDQSYKQRSKTPPNESFSVSSRLDREEQHYRKWTKSSPPKSIGNDAMSKALHQISMSPFSCRIDRAKLPHRFSQPVFTIYNGRTNPIEHVSHFNQRMAIHSINKALMCEVFPSNLGPVTLRWFDKLEEGSISSFKDLIKAFGAWFVTYNKVFRPLDSSLSMVMREGETLKTYFDRY